MFLEKKSFEQNALMSFHRTVFYVYKVMQFFIIIITVIIIINNIIYYTLLILFIFTY